MGKNKGSLFVVVILASLMLMGITVMGYSQQHERSPHPKPQQVVIDLLIEDIMLNEQCFVVVKAKNIGLSMVPDSVWTVHAPDSSGIYLHINGKGWGRDAIWHFDPAKNLQNPGGTATMTSTLKVTGTATITATIDNTGKIQESNETNNQMRKKLTCPAGNSTTPPSAATPIRKKY